MARFQINIGSSKKMIQALYVLMILHLAKTDIDYTNEETNSNLDTESSTKASIRHRVEDPTYLRTRYPLGDLPIDNVHCKKPVKCIRMSNLTCMGTRLPYDSITLDLIPGYIDRIMIMEKLHVLQGLKHIPKCWTAIQPLLCSLFTPKCVNDTVELPSQEMCKKVASNCRLVFNHTIWPSFVRCEDSKLFPWHCKNDIREVKFNTSGKCLSPLVPSDNALAVFDGIEGCAMPCSDPLYTEDEKNQVHAFIFWGAAICCFLNFFTVITFLIDWRSANKYPALAIFYMNCCFMVSCLGWLLQFLQENRDFIVCRKDGTLRTSEPSGENLSCVVVFVSIYYSIIAAMVWFVIFTYTWYMTSQAIGKIQDKIDKKAAYFHLLAWCLPLMLTVTSMALDEIDGNHVTGICFVGYNNHLVRACFVLGPVIITVFIGGYFLIRGLITLVNLKISSEEIITENISSKIQKTIVRMGLFFVFVCVAVIITFHCHVYEFKHSHEWKQSFRNYIICSITSKYADVSECKMESRPSAAKLQLHLLASFFAGALMSSWIWTSSTIATWIRFFKRIFNRNADEPMKLKKHKVIAQAFAKRKTFDNTGRLSITFQNTHEDPVGLNLDLNSVASQDFSTTWAAALPKLVSRRGAVVERGNSEQSSRRGSEDSQFSVNLRRVSVESRRNSYDSQIALSFSEIKADFKTSGRAMRSNKRRRKKKATSVAAERRSKKIKKIRAREDLESSLSSYFPDVNRLMLMCDEPSEATGGVVATQNRPTLVLEMEALEKNIAEILSGRNIS